MSKIYFNLLMMCLSFGITALVITIYGIMKYKDANCVKGEKTK